MNVRAAAWLWIIIGLMVIGLAGCDTGGGRDATNGNTVFKTIIVDPIPDTVNDISSTGDFAGDDASGHVLYLRFHAEPSFVAELITLRGLVETECESDFVRGNMTLPYDRQDDIREWRPFDVDPDTECYTTQRSYTNAWTRGARGVMLYQPLTGIVYYNEIGL